ncbi:MAG: RNA polymerase sigma factor [Acidimicrobiales bacterium]
MTCVMGSNPPRVSTPELKALVERARHGDPDAWEALYRLSYAGLFAYARRRLWGSTDADDAVSETFARAFPRIGDFVWTGGGFNAWLFGILRNVVLEAQRKDGRPALLGGDVEKVDDDCVDGLLRDEEAAALRVAFATLGTEDRELLELRVVGGLCAEEVGAVLGKRPGAVRMAQSRALGRLRSALDQVATSG